MGKFIFFVFLLKKNKKFRLEIGWVLLLMTSFLIFISTQEARSFSDLNLTSCYVDNFSEPCYRKIGLRDSFRREILNFKTRLDDIYRGEKLYRLLDFLHFPERLQGLIFALLPDPRNFKKLIKHFFYSIFSSTGSYINGPKRLEWEWGLVGSYYTEIYKNIFWDEDESYAENMALRHLCGDLASDIELNLEVLNCVVKKSIHFYFESFFRNWISEDLPENKLWKDSARLLEYFVSLLVEFFLLAFQFVTLALKIYLIFVFCLLSVKLFGISLFLINKTFNLNLNFRRCFCLMLVIPFTIRTYYRLRELCG